MMVKEEDYPNFIDLWMTTDNNYNPLRPEDLPLDAYTKVENISLPSVEEVSRIETNNGPGAHSVTGLDVLYKITYNNVPKYDDNGKEIHYVMKENHIVGLDIFGGDNPSAFAMGFDPYEIGYDRNVTHEQLIKAGYSEADATYMENNGVWYSDILPIIAVRKKHAFYGVGENGTYLNACSTISDLIGHFN